MIKAIGHRADMLISTAHYIREAEVLMWREVNGDPGIS